MKPALPFSDDLSARLSGRPLALLLDIDGTLTPVAPRPDQTVVPAETIGVVARLSKSAHVHVAIVTGRSVADARRLVPLEGVGFIGNHGFEVLGEGGDLILDPIVRDHDGALRSAAARILELGARLRGVFVEDKRWTLSAHYRQAASETVPALIDGVKRIAAEHDLVVTHGKEVIEVRPPILINKGSASVLWAKGIGALVPGTAAVYIGDDRTDEDAFHALRAAMASAVTVRVGSPAGEERTEAEFGVESPAEVHAFLTALEKRAADRKA